MLIGLDFDGVIGNTHGLKSVFAKEMFGVSIDPNLFTKNYVVDGGLLTGEEYTELQRRVFDSDGFEPVPDVISSIRQLSSDGFCVKIITARNGTSLSVVERFVHQHRISGCISDITGVGYKISKVDACRGSIAYVDDDSRVLKDVLGVVPNLYMFRWEQNQHEVVPDQVVNVDSWSVLYEKIKALR